LDVAVDPIYSAAFEGDLYEATMSMVAAAFPEAAVLMIGQDSSRLGGNFILQRGGPADLSRAFAGELSLESGWLQRQWDMEIGRIYHDRDLGAVELLNAGPVGQALCEESPALDHFTGVVFSRAGTRQLTVEVRYPRYREAEMRSEVREVLQRIWRHLSYSVRIANLQRRLVEADQLATSVLDLMPSPIVLIDAEQRVSRMSERAEMMVGDGMLLSIGPDGILHLVDPAADIEFAELLAGMRANPKHRVAVMTVPHKPGEPRDILSVVRLNCGTMFSHRALAGLSKHSPRFAVITENLSLPMQLSPDVLWRVFGLSAKEADLASSLLEGKSIGDLAVRRKISKETLRNQLSAILRKTETARQQDLVALLTRLAAVNSTA
jgi:DNA-binding CsgD family transcriptional regulator